MRRTVVFAILIALAGVLRAGPALAGGRPHARRAEAQAELARLLDGGSPQVALARLSFLGEQRHAARELLVAWPRLLDPERRRGVATVIAGLGEPIAERQLVAFTVADDSAIRMEGARGLGRLRSKQVDALLPLLEDGSLGVRREAAKALGASGVKRAARRLLSAARAEGEPEVRAAMLIAAGQSQDVGVSRELASFLDSSSDSTRFAAAQGLCLLGAPRGFEFARALLGSGDGFVRRQGVALFEGSLAARAKPYLEPMLEDPDRRVAAASARILYQGGDTSKLAWLVLASHAATGEDRLALERELEILMLTDDVRRAILARAGIPKAATR